MATDAVDQQARDLKLINDLNHGFHDYYNDRFLHHLKEAGIVVHKLGDDVIVPEKASRITGEIACSAEFSVEQTNAFIDEHTKYEALWYSEKNIKEMWKFRAKHNPICYFGLNDQSSKIRQFQCKFYWVRAQA